MIYCQQDPARPGLAFSLRPQFGWHRTVTSFVRAQIYDLQFDAVLHFAEAKVVEQRPPLFVSFEILGHVSGEKNMSGVAARHHSLRRIKTGTGKVGLTAHIDHAADWATVRSHSKL